MDSNWSDNPTQKNTPLWLARIESMVHSSIVFIFVWFGELVVLLWTIYSINSQNDFLVSSSFLVFWTLVCLLATFYSLSKLKKPKLLIPVKLDFSSISIPVDSDCLSLAFSQIKSIQIINEPEKSEHDSPYLLKITTIGNKVLYAPLFDRKGFSDAINSEPWVKKIIRK